MGSHASVWPLKLGIWTPTHHRTPQVLTKKKKPKNVTKKPSKPYQKKPVSFTKKTPTPKTFTKNRKPYQKNPCCLPKKN